MAEEKKDKGGEEELNPKEFKTEQVDKIETEVATAQNLNLLAKPEENTLSKIPIKVDRGMGKFMNDAKLALASRALPEYIKTPEQAAMIMKVGEELGIKPALALNTLFPINGKVTAPAPIMNAILMRGGVVWETLKDAEQVLDAGRTKVIDMVTIIKFTRKNKDGLIMTELGKFSYTEATTAGLITKEVWKKYLKNMLWWRAFSFGAKRIASDLLNGLNETTEMIDIFDTEFNYVIEGEDIKIVPKNSK